MYKQKAVFFYRKNKINKCLILQDLVFYRKKLVLSHSRNSWSVVTSLHCWKVEFGAEVKKEDLKLNCPAGPTAGHSESSYLVKCSPPSTESTWLPAPLLSTVFPCQSPLLAAPGLNGLFSLVWGLKGIIIKCR